MTVNVRSATLAVAGLGGVVAWPPRGGRSCTAGRLAPRHPQAQRRTCGGRSSSPGRARCPSHHPGSSRGRASTRRIATWTAHGAAAHGGVVHGPRTPGSAARGNKGTLRPPVRFAAPVTGRRRGASGWAIRNLQRHLPTLLLSLSISRYSVTPKSPSNSSFSDG